MGVYYPARCIQHTNLASWGAETAAAARDTHISSKFNGVGGVGSDGGGAFLFRLLHPSYTIKVLI